VGYILYKEMGLLLFKNETRSVSIFLVLICVMNLFIGKEYNSSYEMLSTCIWQGGSFLYNIALPGIFYFEFRILRKNRRIADFIMLIIVFVVGVMTVPVTGLVLSSLMIIVLAASFGIEKAITRRKRMDAGINI
jgi:membrane protease YdiL (CAAX protease family)